MASKQAHLDILVIGGGMIGASLALSLRDLPWSVGLIDPREPDESTPAAPHSAADYSSRVSALSVASEEWLCHLGIWQTLPEDRIGTYHRMQVWDADGSGELDFEPQQANLPWLGHIVENTLVENALWSQLQASAELTLYTACKVNDIERLTQAGPERAPGWQLVLDDGTLLTATLLLIADGARSPTREKLGFATREWSYGQRAVVTTVEHEYAHDQTARQAFHRQGPLAFLPLSRPDSSSIVWSLDTDAAKAFMAQDPEAQADQLSQGIANKLGKVTLAGRVISFPLRQCHAIEYAQPGAALVGDAAHSIHPLAGQGANIGLQDAVALHSALQWAADKRIVLHEPLVLRRYQRARQSHNLTTMAAMEALKRLFGQSHPVAHLLRNQGMRLFGRSRTAMRAATRQAAGF